MPTIRSPPSRAAWIEISHSLIILASLLSRRLHGRRGLKFEDERAYALAFRSPPSRAAWIEIFDAFKYFPDCHCRRLHGRRGLKFHRCVPWASVPRRRLHGRRGLKSCCRGVLVPAVGSPPSRAAWIEIRTADSTARVFECRRLHGRRGLKSFRRNALSAGA